jgi:hypothetical protein
MTLHTQTARRKPRKLVFPAVHTPYDFYEIPR